MLQKLKGIIEAQTGQKLPTGPSEQLPPLAGESGGADTATHCNTLQHTAIQTHRRATKCLVAPMNNCCRVQVSHVAPLEEEIWIKIITNARI